MKKSKKYIVISSLIVIGCIIVFAAWYYIPLHRRIDMTVYDNSGNPSAMQLDLTIRRSLLSKVKLQLHGSIEFEGQQYESTPWFEQNATYYFIEAEQLHKGGTVLDLQQNSLFFPIIEFNSDYSAIDFLLMLKMENGEGRIWRNYIQQG